ncbi:hypothetical protein CTAYLR_007660 [Chrysophaeum taylorii]|uniref:NADP-dependent oxidoreductase domain-containing protein n=1 Tax=Chrysophaeum taylorii TaxID=2483200 RepID=A0AAD7U743_9STRA|nr:hypothetical protein CTAYLR_007660 [Chrysophaeum taylorii]
MEERPAGASCYRSFVFILWLNNFVGSTRALALSAQQVRRDDHHHHQKDRLPKVSRLVFGTLRLHETERPFALLDEAWRLGIRAFDTARVYGNGESEKLLGEWLRGANDDGCGRSPRSQATVITKGGCGAASSFWRPNLCPDSLRRELETSLERLGKVDVYVLHRDEADRNVGEIVETMNQFVEEGLVGAWGVSNWKATRLEAALRYAADSGLVPPRYSSLQDSLATPSREPWPGTVYMDAAERRFYETHPEIAVLGWECLGKGFLAGRWARGDRPDDHECADIYSDRWRENRLKRAYLTEANFDRRDRATKLAHARGYGPEHVAIAWCLSRDYDSHVITATVNPRHLRSNVRALSLDLTPDEARWLETGDGPPPKIVVDAPAAAAIETVAFAR